MSGTEKGKSRRDWRKLLPLLMSYERKLKKKNSAMKERNKRINGPINIWSKKYQEKKHTF
jgi:flagellar biosynthesis chaperone FliJ